VARAGVRACEPAPGPDELAACLAAVFTPLAPTLQIWTGPHAPASEAPRTGERTLFWVHFGVSGLSRYYGSHRVAGGSSDAEKVADPPDPRRPFETELEGGIFVRMPLALAADASGTLPRGRAPVAAEDETTLPSGADRTTRLADVIVAWNVF